MKKYIVAALLILSVCFAKAQTKPDSSKKEAEVFLPVDVAAEYPGGMEPMFKYMMNSTSNSKVAKKLGFKGNIRINFVVERDGSLTDIKVDKSTGEEMDTEAIRIIKEMPKWKPAMQKDLPVRQMFSIPLKFEN